MITVRISDGNDGFEISGHSGMSKKGSDIVCASVSSAAYMVVNTITDVLGVKTEIEIADGFMKIALTEKNGEAERLIKGFRLHIDGIAEQYPQYVIRQK